MQEPAPRVTIEDVEAAIIGESYTLLPNERTTICQLTLYDLGDSGFTVEGSSACVSKANYDPEIGKRLARERALDKVWECLGYGLARDLHRQRVLDNENYQDRLRREYASLKMRADRLSTWLDSANYHQLPADEQEDQKEQFVLMKGYLEILDRRMARLKIHS